MSFIYDDDINSRIKIISQLDKNFFVEASAGSGKTYSLTQRMVALVESGVDVSKICTITFTKAAANEFFERFQNLLSVRSNPSDTSIPLGPTDLPYTTEESRKRCEEALKNIDLCFMGTIDSFCNLLANEHPKKLGIPSSSEVVDLDVFQAYLKDYYLSILNNVEHPLHEKANYYNERIDDPLNTFLIGMTQIMERRDSVIHYEPINLPFDEYIDKDRRNIIKFLDEILNNPTMISSGTTSLYAYNNLRQNVFYLKNPDWSRFYKKICKLLKSSLAELRFTSEVEDSFLFENEYVLKKPRSYVANMDFFTYITSKINDYFYSIAMSFFVECKDDVSQIFKEKGILTYFDYLYHLRNTLKLDQGQGRVLSNHILNRHSYFLIDESQDTNPIQTELFFYITSTYASSNWVECRPKAGSLFIVGDPKQSIYRFRGADVKSYNDIKELFKSIGEVLYLTRNFRSNLAIRSWLNLAMPKLFVGGGDEACIHKDIPLDIKEDRLALENKASLNGVYKYFIDEGKSIKKIDCPYVANLINKLVNNPKYTIIAKKDKEPRKIRYSDFMIITYSTKFDEYLAKFKEEKIPFISEGKSMFCDSRALTIIEKFMKLIASPYEEKYYVELLTSEYFHFSNYHLEQLKDVGFSFHLMDEVKTSISEIDEVIAKINLIYNKVKNLTYASTFQYLIDNLDLFSLVGLDYLEYLYYALEIVRVEESNGNLEKPNDLLSLLDSINAGSKDYERVLRFKDKVDAVKIANVHKVKGLQAPIVILANPDKRSKSPSEIIKRNFLGSDCYFFNITNPKDEKNQTCLSTSIYDDLFEEATKLMENESKRISYVAATRAESVLIISDSKSSKNPWSDLLDDACELAEINGEDDFIYQNQDIEELVKNGYTAKEELFNDFDKLLNPSFKEIKPSQIKIQKITEKEDLDLVDIKVLESNYRKEAALKGTCVHRLMEALINAKGNCDLNSLVDLIISEYDADNLKEMLIKVGMKILDGGYNQNDSALSNILSITKKAKMVMTELPFSYMENNTVITGIIDLLYLDEFGYHIVDYKTNYEEDIKTLSQKYKSQLDNYVKALKYVMNISSDAKIYHIDLNEK